MFTKSTNDEDCRGVLTFLLMTATYKTDSLTSQRKIFVKKFDFHELHLNFDLFEMTHFMEFDFFDRGSDKIFWTLYTSFRAP